MVFVAIAMLSLLKGLKPKTPGTPPARRCFRTTHGIIKPTSKSYLFF